MRIAFCGFLYGQGYRKSFLGKRVVVSTNKNSLKMYERSKNVHNLTGRSIYSIAFDLFIICSET